MSSQWGSQKILLGLVSHELAVYLFIFNLFKLDELWSYYQKHVNQIILNHPILYRLALRIFEAYFRSNCVDRKFFPWIKLSWHSSSVWDTPGWLNWFWQFLCQRLSSFNPKGFKYSYALSSSLFEGRTSFCTALISRLMFLSGFTSLSVLLLFPLLITFFSFVHGFWFYFI